MVKKTSPLTSQRYFLCQTIVCVCLPKKLWRSIHCNAVIFIFTTLKKRFMLVVKFGGTSVGKPERMKKIADLVTAMPGKKIVVLSALSGTTNALVRMGEQLIAQQQTAALQE